MATGPTKIVGINPHLLGGVIDEDIFGREASNAKPSQPYLIDLETREKLSFQNIPLEIAIGNEPKWVAINAPGRNGSLYQYTGSEDTISFTLTFYADHISRQDVIKKVKWLESLTKNDGYDKKPHNVALIFGQLFRDAKWIVKSAVPKISDFNREFEMLPLSATIEITLGRLETAGNRTRSNVLNINT